MKLPEVFVLQPITGGLFWFAIVHRVDAPSCAVNIGTSHSTLACVARVSGLTRVASLALMAGLGFCGCSSFNREWRDAGKKPMPTNTITGRWEGRWISDVNGHNGVLRCIISGAEDGACEARFRATYMKVLKFGYTVPLSVVQTNGVWRFHGEEDLGAMAGGVYCYEGRATATDFHSTYRSEYDHGTFQMRRPERSD
jgi:hypothetical protein